MPEAVQGRLEALQSLRPSSPKRPPRDATAEEWYGYYAGYANAFVSEIVGALPNTTGVVLDPWNGSGTTTSVATAGGLRSLGFDINPAAVVVAKARLLRSDVAESIGPLTEEIVGSALSELDTPEPDDALLWWFAPITAAALRTLERRAYRLLVSADDDGRLVDNSCLERCSSLAALFYLGLFRVVRPLLQRFIGTNPTWIRRRVAPDDRVEVAAKSIGLHLQHAMASLADTVKTRGHAYEGCCPSTVSIASSTALPAEDDSVDAVITSPPYCTRIDYAIATLPELAALGISNEELAQLRNRMLGTPTMGASHLASARLPERAVALLDAVAKHPSRAARAYYLPFYRQYLEGMTVSLGELQRVTACGAPVVLVAQDSYFKDHHVDVPDLLAEMAVDKGWELLSRHRYPVAPNRNKAAIHGRARAYRAKTPATESVLVFCT